MSLPYLFPLDPPSGSQCIITINENSISQCANFYHSIWKYGFLMYVSM